MTDGADMARRIARAKRAIDHVWAEHHAQSVAFQAFQGSVPVLRVPYLAPPFVLPLRAAGLICASVLGRGWP